MPASPSAVRRSTRPSRRTTGISSPSIWGLPGKSRRRSPGARPISRASAVSTRVDERGIRRRSTRSPAEAPRSADRLRACEAADRAAQSEAERRARRLRAGAPVPRRSTTRALSRPARSLVRHRPRSACTSRSRSGRRDASRRCGTSGTWRTAATRAPRAPSRECPQTAVAVAGSSTIVSECSRRSTSISPYGTPHINASRLRYSILSRSSDPEMSPWSGEALWPRMSA